MLTGFAGYSGDRGGTVEGGTVWGGGAEGKGLRLLEVVAEEGGGVSSWTTAFESLQT